MECFPSSELTEWGENIFDDDHGKTDLNDEHYYQDVETFDSHDSINNQQIGELPVEKSVSKPVKPFRYLSKIHDKFGQIHEVCQKRKKKSLNISLIHDDEDYGKEQSLSIQPLSESVYSYYEQFKNQNISAYLNAMPKKSLYENAEDAQVFPSNTCSTIPMSNEINQSDQKNLYILKDQCFDLSVFWLRNNIERFVPDKKDCGLFNKKINELSDEMVLESVDDEMSIINEFIENEESNHLIEKDVVRACKAERDNIKKVVTATIFDDEEMETNKGSIADNSRSVNISGNKEIKESSSIVSFVDDSTSVPAETTQLLELGSLKSSSVLERMRSLINKNSRALNDGAIISGSRSASEDSSTCSPVSVVVPALKLANGFISELADTISEGESIQPDFYSNSKQEHFVSQEDNEAKPLNIRNPNDFLAQSPQSISPEFYIIKRHSSIDSFSEFKTTIKFDKFAQLLFYDASKRLKCVKNTDKLQSKKKQEDLKNRQDMFKNNGTLVLKSSGSSLCMERLKKLSSYSKFPEFTNISEGEKSSKQTSKEFKIIDPFKIQHNYKIMGDKEIKPILKSKLNKNEKAESLRARYCDDVEMEDFMTFFETHERKRQESEPYLEQVRERQLLTYYSAVDSRSII
ncbi:hypothetical protein WICMUC_000998 [Wickerhamomyces mucosus]|uniref:Uncharacterized protein n=1 Tax=Wickerhamomyces mucosus TaxID=1378264 RepID=A0A9P8PW06_9ASCO|nr:hypothetical protein WICMUC_000998 [Wickerhamomyces mucosus]